jgi:hypothetical protein
MQSGLQNSCRSRGRMASGLVPDSNRLKNQVAECAVKQLIAVFFELLPNLALGLRAPRPAQTSSSVPSVSIDKISNSCIPKSCNRNTGTLTDNPVSRRKPESVGSSVKTKGRKPTSPPRAHGINLALGLFFKIPS